MYMYVCSYAHNRKCKSCPSPEVATPSVITTLHWWSRCGISCWVTATRGATVCAAVTWRINLERRLHVLVVTWWVHLNVGSFLVRLRYRRRRTARREGRRLPLVSAGVVSNTSAETETIIQL